VNPLEDPAVAEVSTVERTRPRSWSALYTVVQHKGIPCQKYLVVDPCMPSYFCDLTSVTTVGMKVLVHARREAEIRSPPVFAINLYTDLRVRIRNNR
jgi:hypothetical protein